MSSGVLFIAFDSETDHNKTIHYTQLARIAKNLAKRHLGLPCAIVSDSVHTGFDESIVVDNIDASNRHVKIGDTHQSYPWYNNYRVRADQLTPWSRTLILDVDYFLQSSNFLNVVNSDSEFSIIKNTYDPTGRQSFDRYRFLPNRTIPQLWATAMCWDNRAEYIFDYAREIHENYQYYSRVFGFSEKVYRNDMIFSIAAHMAKSDVIPFPMWMTSSDCDIEDANNSGLKISYDVAGQKHVQRIGTDIHMLSKSIATDYQLLDKLEQWSLQ